MRSEEEIPLRGRAPGDKVYASVGHRCGWHGSMQGEVVERDDGQLVGRWRMEGKACPRCGELFVDPVSTPEATDE